MFYEVLKFKVLSFFANFNGLILIFDNLPFFKLFMAKIGLFGPGNPVHKAEFTHLVFECVFCIAWQFCITYLD
jgi:hypothetical protein